MHVQRKCYSIGDVVISYGVLNVQSIALGGRHRVCADGFKNWTIFPARYTFQIGPDNISGLPCTVKCTEPSTRLEPNRFIKN